MTRHSASINFGGYVDRGGSRSQDTRHYSYINQGKQVDVEERGGYRSPTRNYYSPNQVECGRLLTFSGDTVGDDERVGYRWQTSRYYSQRGDSKVDSARHGSRSEETNHSSLFNVGESVVGIWLSGYRSRTSPYTSHNQGNYGR